MRDGHGFARVERGGEGCGRVRCGGDGGGDARDEDFGCGDSKGQQRVTRDCSARTSSRLRPWFSRGRSRSALILLMVALLLAMNNTKADVGESSYCLPVFDTQTCAAVADTETPLLPGLTYDLLTLDEFTESLGLASIEQGTWNKAFKYSGSKNILNTTVPESAEELNELRNWCQYSNSCSLGEDDPISNAPQIENATESDPLRFMFKTELDLTAGLPTRFRDSLGPGEGEKYTVLQIGGLSPLPREKMLAQGPTAMWMVSVSFEIEYEENEIVEIDAFAAFQTMEMVINSEDSDPFREVQIRTEDIKNAFVAAGLADRGPEVDLQFVSEIKAEVFIEFTGVPRDQLSAGLSMCVNITLEHSNGNPNVYVSESADVGAETPSRPAKLFVHDFYRDETLVPEYSDELDFLGENLAGKEMKVSCLRAITSGGIGTDGGDGSPSPSPEGAADGDGEGTGSGAEGKSVSTGAIVGGVVGGVAAIGVVVGIVWFVVAKKRRGDKDAIDDGGDEEAGWGAVGDGGQKGEKAGGDGSVGGADVELAKMAGDRATPDATVAAIGAVGGVDSMDMHTQNSNTESSQQNSGASYSFDQVVISKAKVRKGDMIGAGGFASVYRGQYGGEDVAVKVLFKTTQDLVGKDAAQTFFQTQELPSMGYSVPSSAGAMTHKAATGCIPEDVLREITSLEKCRHPAVAGFYGVCLGSDENDPVWLVMELAKRGTLQDQLVNTTIDDFSWQERIKVAYQVSLGMEYLHTAPRNIAHFDLKPANIILTEAGMPKVIDFGIAGFYSVDGESSGLRARRRGTLMYMAPELLNISDNEELREPEKADVFSFGMLCFVLAHQTGNRGAAAQVSTSAINPTWSATPVGDLPEGAGDDPQPLEEVHNNTMGSYLGGFELNMSLDTSAMGESPVSPLLAHSHVGESTSSPPVAGGNAVGTISPASPLLSHARASGLSAGLEDGVDAEWMRTYLSRIDELMFRLSDTARSNAQVYFERVMAFRAEYGYQMRCAPQCPVKLRQVVALCTHPDPSQRPTFSELTQVLYEF